MLQKIVLPLYTFLVPVFYFIAILYIVQQERNYGFGFVVLSILGVFILLIGLLLWSISLITLGKNLSVYPEGRKLVTTGVYHLCKHPFYVGINLTFTGMSIVCGSWLGLVITGLLVLPLNTFRAKTEEVVLRETFGKEYDAYEKKVVFPL